MQVPVNYLAVIAAAAVNVALGFAWYGPLFGKQWIRLSGMRMDEKPSGMGKAMAVTIVGSILMSYVLQHSLVFASSYLAANGISAGLMAGFWSWLGFIAPVTIGPVLWEKKPWMLWVLNAGYYLVALLIMGAILAVWM